MRDTSSTRRLSRKDHEALYNSLQPGDRTAALKLLNYEYSAAYVAMVADPENPRYNAEVIQALITAVEQRAKRTQHDGARVRALRTQTA